MKTKRVHFVGIKGVGMAPLAVVAKEAGFAVSGCDIEEEFITDSMLNKSGIKPLIGFTIDHLVNTDLVITTGAHGGFDNPEVREAKIRNIPVLTQGEAVGSFMRGAVLGRNDMEGISIAGAHGKTTTTAMIATILKENGLDPSYVIGTSEIYPLGESGHYGKGKYFIAEADEYSTEPQYDKTPKFLWQFPQIAVFTNIEFDHPDTFSSEDRMEEAFLEFSKNISLDGVLIGCGDNTRVENILKSHTGKKISYGFSEKNDFVIKKVSVRENQMFFWVEGYGTVLGEFCVRVGGDHNALNATASIIVGLETGLSISGIKKALEKFSGSKRRMEFVGFLPTGGLLFDDYAHHPTEIKETLAGLKKSYPNKKIVCIFQPHTYTRTKKLFDQFINSFFTANTVIITNIYPSLREEIDPNFSSKFLIEKMTKFHPNAIFLPEALDVVKYIQDNDFGADTIVITMGAGDIYKLKKQLISSSL